MLTNNSTIEIDDILENQEYTANPFSPELSSNRLLKISTGGSLYILKIYKKKDCFENELDFMYLFMNNKCKVPRLVKYSSINSSQSWILYEFVEGISLNQIKSQISSKTLKHIWKQVGKELKKVHSISVFNKAEIESNKMDFVNRLKSSIDNFSNHLDNKDASAILVDAIHFLRNNLSRIKKTIFGIVLNDFNDRHIIIRQRKEKWTFNAFIDFERTCFGCPYVDIVGLYLNALLENQELEECFLRGYESERMNIDDHCIRFFLIYFGMELCTVLRNINVNHYPFGLSLIEKTFERIDKLNEKLCTSTKKW